MLIGSDMGWSTLIGSGMGSSGPTIFEPPPNLQ